jgi:hypothetical protein
MMLFATMNGLMLFWISDSFRQMVEKYLAMSAARQALVGFPLLIAVTLAAYIFSTLNLLQREILEGEYLPSRAKGTMTAGQQRRIDDSDKQLATFRQHRRGLRKLKGVERLRTARDEGNKLKNECKYSDRSEAAKIIAVLAKKTLRHEFIDIKELEQAVSWLEAELSKCPVDLREPQLTDIDKKVLLNAHQELVYKCLDFKDKETENNYVASFTKREFNFSSYRLAPTSMGNIAESVRGYARSRYAMNLDPFWSRLQKVLAGDEKFYATMVDAKTQLDFLISLFWLTVSFTALWIIMLLYLRRSMLAFLIVALAGPVLSALWYQIALQNYRAFADILRTSIDLYRFELLDALHIRRPNGNEHERRTWTELNQIIGYGDSAVRVSYQHRQEQ